jgi:outer membrane receptor protein involved in Fe transport
MRLAAIALLASATARAQRSGTVAGTVGTRGTGGALVFLPAATVRLMCPGWSQPRETTSDGSGRYLFRAVPAGRCTITAQAAGFTSASQMIEVKANQAIEADLHLALAKIEERVTVRGTSPTSAEVGSTSTAAPAISQKSLQLAPLVSERFQDALPLIPGVVRGPDGLMDVRGASPSQSATLLNQASATDPVTGQEEISLPIEAVESVKVLPNPFSAQYGRFVGGVTEVQTRSGTNRWNVLFTDFFPRLRYRQGHWVGLESITPRFTFAGPLHRDRLFLFQSFDYRFVRVRVPSLPDLRNDKVFETFDSQTQLDWNVNQSNHMTGSFTFYPQNLSFVNLNTFNPLEVTPDLRRRGWQAAGNERAILDGSVLETVFSAKRLDFHVWPSSGRDGTLELFPEQNHGIWFNHQDRNSFVYQFAQTLHAAAWTGAGRHLPLVGYNVARASYDGAVRNGPVTVLREDGTTSQTIDFTPAARLASSQTDAGFFAQDQWSLVPRFTVNLGARFDHDGLSGDAVDVAPRIAFVFAPTRDNKTALRAGLGLFYDKIPLDISTFAAYPAEQVTFFGADGTTPISGPLLFTHRLVAPGGLHVPYSVIWEFQADREIRRRLLFRFGYAERKTHREFFLNPVAPGEGAAALELLNSGRQSYREFQWTVRWQPSENDRLFASFVRSEARGELNGFEQYLGNVPDPILRANEHGPLPWDAPNRFIAWGSLRLPWKLDFWPVVDVHTGFPFSKVDSELNYVGPRNEAGRFPAFFSFDFQLTREFKVKFLGKKRGLRAGVKIFNVTGHDNPRDVQQNLTSPHFGGFYNSIGRIYRAKFEFQF